MSESRFVVAIDGPAGSGKSTVTHLLAKRLGFAHIDTGALYRAIAYRATQMKTSLDDALALGKIATSAKLSFQWLNDRNQIFLDGENVSSMIRTPEISMAASKISAYAPVRDALLQLQRDLGARPPGAVLEGRDIGTVVFPNAEIKFYLNASVDSRARRRMVELEEKGTFLDFEEVKRQVVERDKGDMERKVAPLKKADDAIEVDTTNMNVEQVVDFLFALVQERRGLAQSGRSKGR
ncbi:MAG TPA: (d)CMP kinase [Oligoflexia bacterium]|nr:(d)CMP kinase [Oligoflexia bacterium]